MNFTMHYLTITHATAIFQELNNPEHSTLLYSTSNEKNFVSAIVSSCCQSKNYVIAWHTSKYDRPLQRGMAQNYVLEKT
jgi:hypothetical protein